MAAYRHNHILPRGQLRPFSVDGMIDCHFVDGTETRRIGINDAGVRSGFYVEKRDDGSRSPAFELAMNPAETKGIEMLREIEERWPLSINDRGPIAELLGLQAVRSPAWRAWFDRERRRSLEEKVVSTPFPGAPAWRRFEAYSESDHFRLDSMARQIHKMGSLFGSMHWTLVRLRADRLLIADQPVVPVPFPGREGAPAAAVPRVGFGNTIEVYFPVTPRLALVMTWLEEPDDGPPREGRVHWVKNINGASRAQADRQWFTRPGTSAPQQTGPCLCIPVGSELHRLYGLTAAQRSERRRQALEVVNRMIEESLSPDRMTIIGVSRAPASRRAAA